MRARNRIPHCTTFWMVALLLFTTRGLSAQTSVVVQIDAGANRHAISQLIYGLNYAGANALSDLRCPLQRLGGNNLSRYNWQINADNKGSDYFFESIGDASSVPAARYDNFVALNQAAGAASMVTIPFVGWVAKLGSNRAPLAGFSVAKYGVQTGFDWQYLLNAGNGIGCDGNPIKSNDPNDADVPSDVAFQQGLVQHLLNGWGTAANGGVAYYLMDNEPSLWHLTHRDVHPIGETMDELYSKTESYAAMIKALDPTAMVAGPEEWGWTGYFNSGYDQQTGGHTDRDAHGGMDVIPWLLQQMQQYDQANGQSLLDILSLHYYPQGGEFSEDYTLATQLLRNRSTRSLWDPTYRDESWIDDYVQLIPRMKSWATTYYPGTLSAITEYNWGAESHINGATTQADLLGIFGREGLDMATRWATPGASSPVRSAIQIYRNYDGAGSAFGDT